MTSMTRTTVGVTGGVDTHGQSHHAAVIDHVGRQLDDREFPASPVGYRALLEWLQGHGEVDRVGVEGTGTYGAALARHLRGAGILIVEVDRPDRRARRAHGKSDPLDAYSAARAALSGAASVVPKLRDGRVEAIRALRVARSSAIKARSQAMNQIKSLIVTGPAQLREQLRHLPTLKLIAACARLRPRHQLGDTEHATKTALPTGTSPSTALRGNRRRRPRALSTRAPGRPRLACPFRRWTRSRRPGAHQRRRQP
jgi:transposase